MTQQAHFVGVVLALEPGNGFFQAGFAAVERQVGFGQAAHFGFQRAHFLRGERFAPFDFAVIAAGGHRVVNIQPGLRKQVGEGGFEQKGERAAINPRAIRVRHRDRLEAGFQFDAVGQLVQFAVDDDAHNRRRPFSGNRTEEFFRRCAARPLQRAAIGQVNLNGGGRLGEMNVAHNQR